MMNMIKVQQNKFFVLCCPFGFHNEVCGKSLNKQLLLTKKKHKRMHVGNYLVLNKTAALIYSDITRCS